MKIYRSKIGAELVIPISVILTSVGAFMVYEKTWIGFIFILAIACFITHTLLTT
jgi:hypothetical protein